MRRNSGGAAETALGSHIGKLLLTITHEGRQEVLDDLRSLRGVILVGNESAGTKPVKLDEASSTGTGCEWRLRQRWRSGWHGDTRAAGVGGDSWGARESLLVAVTAMRVVALGPGTTASPNAVASETPTAATSATPVPSPLPSLTGAPSATPSPSTRGPLAGDLPGSVTLSGSSAWMLLDSGVSLSNDGGRTWTTVALPSGVASSKVAAVATAPGRPLWLAVGSGVGYRLYRKPNAGDAWSSVLLAPSWGSLGYPGGYADMVRLTPGPGSLVTVAETMSGGMDSAITSLFVSNDDGKSFVQHPPPSGGDPNTYTYWGSVTFTTPESGLVIAGPSTYPHYFLHTSDGGTTWSEATVTGLPAAPNYTPDTPLLVGSDIVVPVSICGADCGTNTFSMLVSHDGGATFNPMGVPIPSGENSYPAVAALGPVIWVAAGDAIEETIDGGKTWTDVAATSLPINVTAFDLTGPTSATAIVVDSGCAGFKTDCWYRNYLVATTDGGRTWTHLQVLLRPSSVPRPALFGTSLASTGRSRPAGSPSVGRGPPSPRGSTKPRPKAGVSSWVRASVPSGGATPKRQSRPAGPGGFGRPDGSARWLRTPRGSPPARP